MARTPNSKYGLESYWNIALLDDPGEVGLQPPFLSFVVRARFGTGSPNSFTECTENACRRPTVATPAEPDSQGP